MYKVHGVDILTADNEYRKGIRKMFPTEEDIANEAYYNVINTHYGIFSDKEPDENFDALVQEEIENIQEKERKYKKSKRVIKTARTETEINDAVERGYKPLIKEVIPSDEIRVMYALERDLETGKVTILQDSWEIYAHHKGTEKVIDKVYYYPYQFPSPFAAYLIPPDIVVGEMVILEDLIEDIVGARHKMHTYRLASAEAMWNGERFVISHDSYSVSVTMG